MERIDVVGLMELDRSQMGSVIGGTLAPSRDTSFWYDLAYAIAYGAGRVADAYAEMRYLANSGSYSYAKTGTP